MPVSIKGNVHNFGFKPFGAIDRAVVVGTGATGTLPTTGSSTLSLGLSWRVKLRVRRTSTAAAYLLNYMFDASTDGFGLFHGVTADTYELFSYGTTNATGALVRFAMTATVTDALYHEIEFTYTGTTTTGTLSAFLDGAPAGTLAVPNFALSLPAGAIVRLAGRPGAASFAGGVSSLLLEAGGVALVNLGFDEASGNALNTGTLGGEMTFTDGGTRETL